MPRVTYRWGTSIGYEGNDFPSLDPGDNLCASCSFGVVVAHDERIVRDRKVCEERTRPSRVLTCNGVCRGQRFDRPRRKVAEVANWGRNENQRGPAAQRSRWWWRARRPLRVFATTDPSVGVAKVFDSRLEAVTSAT